MIKQSILTTAVTTLLLTTGATIALADQAKTDVQPKTIVADKPAVKHDEGTATVTIEVGGKKETRTFNLGSLNGLGAFVGGLGIEGRVGRSGTPDKNGSQQAKVTWLGVVTEPVPDVVCAQLKLAPGEGLVINHVGANSPAAGAGLQANDILLRFDDQIPVNRGQIKKLIAMKKAGDTVKLVYLRKGERKQVDVTLAEREVGIDELLDPDDLVEMLGSFQGPGGPNPFHPPGLGFNSLPNGASPDFHAPGMPPLPSQFPLGMLFDEEDPAALMAQIRGILKANKVPKNEADAVLGQVDKALKEDAKPPKP